MTLTFMLLLALAVAAGVVIGWYVLMWLMGRK